MFGRIHEPPDGKLAEMIENVRSGVMGLHRRWMVFLLLSMFTGLWLVFALVIIPMFPDFDNTQKGTMIALMVVLGPPTIARDPFIPTRLLDVQSSKQSGVHLVEGSEVDFTSDYIAFSHCWGPDDMPLKLNESNLNALKSGHGFEQLPKNFQHAIKIARALHVRYAWIDSLCIIQDSPSDWATESKKMGDVYNYAMCVVSATASKDFNGGCFFPRRPLKSDSICVLRTQGTKSLVVRAPETSDQQIIDNLFGQYVNKAPLTSRGWTFQERVLGRRILHFCDGVVLFECNYIRASEYHVNGVMYPKKLSLRTDGKVRSDVEVEALAPAKNRYITVEQRVMGQMPAATGARSFPYNQKTEVNNPDWKPPAERRMQFFRNAALSGQRGDFQMLLHFKGTTPMELIEFHNSWYSLVEEYSRRMLTFPTDKVPALSGVALTVQEAVGFNHARSWKRNETTANVSSEICRANMVLDVN
ncbi:hypothetical protein G7Z17_g12715 [Cylindrodendrum hubeiense]|uniref:Heterokaryon incompatibility domain-containing protein n=1 Tax=Cylindrodendrum hubeiense TaxID=595255 RepID=A0A9P5H0C9_9HYPO|nr:hypothetical protein G7Z17_g12715 [Cylindrodendrum hubeiense]